MNRLAQFNSIKKSWFGAGGEPVSMELAQQRANICYKCPKNDKGQWIWDAVKRWLIARQLRLREIMNLHVEGEKELGTCDACGCVLKLKIFVPLTHITKHTSPQQMEKFHTDCWIRNEKPQ